MLCLMGAVVGFAITSLAAWAGSTLLEVEFLSPTIPPSQILIAILVSVLVGVLAGIIPAFRAARMDPVDALRAE
jgi:putative ABC transport system permease protein